MKARHLLVAEIFVVLIARSANAQAFAGEYADKKYQGGSAVFQMSIEGSGNNTQVWFSAVKNDGQGAQPEGQGMGKITSNGTLEFKFQDSCHNSGTGTITRRGEDIVVSMTTVKKADAGCAAFYGSSVKLKRVKE